MDTPIEILLEYIDLCFKESRGWESEEGWDLFRLDEDDIQAMIAHKEDSSTVFIMFRGTDSMDDIIKDVNIFQRKFVLPYEGMEDSKIRVHSGFIKAWKTVREYVIQYLLFKYEENPEMPIEGFIFIGHSLGGAIAQLASLDLKFHMGQLDYPIEVSCVTFGAPRVGNGEFKRSRDERVPQTLNVVNDDDPVFFQPWWSLGYRRSGKVLYIGKKPFVWLPSVLRIKSHYLTSYLDNLKAKAEDTLEDIGEKLRG